MCMAPNCTGGGSKPSSSRNTGYTPKSRTAKSSYTPNGVPNAFSNTGFGKPAVKMSFGGKR